MVCDLVFISIIIMDSYPTHFRFYSSICYCTPFVKFMPLVGHKFVAYIEVSAPFLVFDSLISIIFLVNVVTKLLRVMDGSCFSSSKFLKL